MDEKHQTRMKKTRQKHAIKHKCEHACNYGSVHNNFLLIFLKKEKQN